jgi:chromosome segregation ATPase
LEVVRKSAHLFNSNTHSFQHFLAPAIASAEANRIQTLETLLDEYRQLLATGDSTERKESQETAAQFNEEKNRLLQQIKELNETINSLKYQLEQLSSKVIFNHYFSQQV